MQINLWEARDRETDRRTEAAFKQPLTVELERDKATSWKGASQPATNRSMIPPSSSSVSAPLSVFLLLTTSTREGKWSLPSASPLSHNSLSLVRECRQKQTSSKQVTTDPRLVLGAVGFVNSQGWLRLIAESTCRSCRQFPPVIRPFNWLAPPPPPPPPWFIPLLTTARSWRGARADHIDNQVADTDALKLLEKTTSSLKEITRKASDIVWSQIALPLKVLEDHVSNLHFTA